jgi:hypothetical protein
MSYLETGSLLHVIRAIAGAVVFKFWVDGADAAGRLAGEAGLVLIGKASLIFIAATVAAGLIVQIATLIFAFVSGAESRPGDLDERDRLIELKAIARGFAACGLGFVAFFLGLALGWPLIAALHLLFGGFILSDILVNALKVLAYRRGRP